MNTKKIFLNLSKLYWMGVSIFFLSSAAQASDSLPLDIQHALAPQKIVNDLLNPYSEAEKKKIDRDFQSIHSLIFSEAESKSEKVYLATAGSPGSSKTTILEVFLRDHPEFSHFAYIDPDQRALKFMNHTYKQSLTNYEFSKAPVEEVLNNAYKKWRDASNYIANSFLNEAFSKGYSIAHGATSTTPAMGKLYESLRKNHYYITLLLCVSPEENCIKACDYRASTQAFFQSSSEDIINKGKMFFERFETYFQWADKIHLYWVSDYLKLPI